MHSETAHFSKGVLDHSKYLNQKVRCSLVGGRVCRGILKGSDAANNLVLDSCEELREDDNRELGFLVIKGTSLQTISPELQEIANPLE